MASKISKPEKRKYADTLDQPSKQRYVDKLKLINDIDPYEVNKKDWRFDRDNLPEITYPDLVMYLVYKQSAYTMQEMKAYKSLESYNHFVSGWVKDVASIEINGRNVISAKVKHSQRMNDPPLHPWLIAEKDGSVLAAHCTCMAGLGEACSHVAALLFYVDATVRIRSTKTVTQEPAYWLIPNSVQKIEYNMVKDINFRSAKRLKKNLDESILSPKVNTPKRQPASHRLPNVPAPTQSEMSDFLFKLYNTGTKPVVLSVMPDYAEHYVPSCLGESFPSIMSEFFNEQCVSMSESELESYCRKVLSELVVTKKHIENVEVATRNQSSSKEWFRFRTGRITASKMKSVCSTKIDKPSKTVVNGICYPLSHKFKSKATTWGCEHEVQALEEYSDYMNMEHENFKISKCGFFISEDYSFIGASPDSLVSCDCCGEGTVEVKCPFCVKHDKISADKVTCLEDRDGLKLKKSHEYFYQVQTQIFVCNKDYCDFIVWTEKDVHIERIEPDQEFWDSTVEKAESFFLRVILPELVAKKLSNQPISKDSASKDMPVVPVNDAPCVKSSVQSSSSSSSSSISSECLSSVSLNQISVQRNATCSDSASQELICICKVPYDPKFGRVIGCDNQNCAYQWLHFKCINLKRAPKGNWFCPECRLLPQFQKGK